LFPQNIEEPTTTAVMPPEGEPMAASNDMSASEASRGSETIPMQSSTNGGCSLSRTRPMGESHAHVVFGMALGLSLAALGRIRRRR
jgi:hypothetical protein